MKKRILMLKGDGIGPELMQEGMKTLEAVARKYGHNFEYTLAPFGAGAYFSELRSCYPKETRGLVTSGDVDGILKGPVGLNQEGSARLRDAGVKLENETIIALRADLDSYCCYRPVRLPQALGFFSPLRPEIVGGGINILMMRELVGGAYFGPKSEGVSKTGAILESSTDDCTYKMTQIARFARACFREAEQRKVQLTNVHKANILATGRHWQAIFAEVSREFPGVPMQECLVDAFATYLNTKPTVYNGVVALENLQGDIETDHAGGIIGSLGLMPSACINPETGKGYYEPSHGSAPDIAGKNSANPYSMIGSVAFMLEKCFGMVEEAKDVWNALQRVFAQGNMTGELVRRLSRVQKAARADAAFTDLASAFRIANPDLEDSKIKTLISNAYDQRDADLQAMVVSTSQFGDLVAANIVDENPKP